MMACAFHSIFYRLPISVLVEDIRVEKVSYNATIQNYLIVMDCYNILPRYRLFHQNATSTIFIKASARNFYAYK